jgi:hypothetical protein
MDNQNVLNLPSLLLLMTMMTMTTATVYLHLTEQVELNTNTDLSAPGTWFESHLGIWPF